MTTTFEHEVDLIDGLTLRFTSKKLHSDAGVAWPWHHAMLVLGTVGGDRNPIASAFGDDLFVDDVLRARHVEVFTSVEQTQPTKKTWVTTVVFTDAKWLPPVSAGHRWTSSA